MRVEDEEAIYLVKISSQLQQVVDDFDIGDMNSDTEIDDFDDDDYSTRKD